MREAESVLAEPGGSGVSGAAGDRPSGRAAPAATGRRRRRRRRAGNTPQYVTRGVMFQTVVADRSFGVDWYRVRGPSRLLSDVVIWGSQWWGAPERWSGVHFYDSRLVWASGAQVWYDRQPFGADHLTLELPGQALATVPAADRWAWVLELWAMGFRHPCRIDLALDFRNGTGATLIADVLGGCGRREHCGAKQWEKVEKRGAGNRLKAWGANVGVRGGNGSGRYLRIYDKGLEQRCAPEGEWVRMEGEYSGECARTVVGLLMEADQRASGVDVASLFSWHQADVAGVAAGWQSQGIALVLGTVDFREVTGHRAYSRRPRCEWWKRVLQGVEPRRVRLSSRSRPRLAAYSRWFRRAVAPSLVAMSRGARRSVEDVFRDLVGDLDDIETAALRGPAWEYVEAALVADHLEARCSGGVS